MSKVVGIIAEYNPFHNGHLYHIKKSIEQENADFVICIISGNFMQRGNTSIIDKWTKAKMAVLQGADLVLELPTVYSVSSAENFAEGAIRILDSLKIVNTISFGMEARELSTLNNIVKVLSDEPREYSLILSHELKKGISYPKARENALMFYLNDIKRYANIMNSSNNILAIEYLKALRKLKVNIKPLGIQREKVLYNDEIIVDGFTSSTAIRKMIVNRQFEDIIKVMPRASYFLLAKSLRDGHYVLDLSKFQTEIIYRLRTMTVEEIKALPDVSEGLEYLIKQAANSCNNIIDLVNKIKSKRYTQTRIQRILVYVLLGIDKKLMENSKKNQSYVRVLGMNENGKKLLSEISRKNPKIKLVVSVKKFMEKEKNKYLREMMEMDIKATNIYTLGYEKDSFANLDYTNKIVTFEDLKKGVKS